MEIWEKLRELREDKNLTYEKLHEDLPLNEKISISTLKAYESKSSKNRRKISGRNVEILSKYFDIPKEYLLYEDFNIKKKENIDINEILGFSDITIEKIKSLKGNEYNFHEDYNQYLNLLFENVNLYIISFDLKCISVLKEYYDILFNILGYFNNWKEFTCDNFYEYINSLDIEKLEEFSNIRDIKSSLKNIVYILREEKNKNQFEKYDLKITDYLNRLYEMICFKKYEISKEITRTLDNIFDSTYIV